MITYRKKRFSFLLIILLLLLIFFPARLLADTEKIFKENNGSVVVINTYDKHGKLINQGSGFIVRDDGAIVTNYHVISNAKNIKVKSGGKVLKVEGLIHTDMENNLVILKVKGKNLPAVKIGDAEKGNAGHVYLISSPEGRDNKISEGEIRLIKEIVPNVKILQITTTVLPGSSGGAVFNENGEVIGIATFIIENTQNINFAIPVNLIKDKISAEKVITLKNAKIKDYKKTVGHWVYLGIAYDALSMHKEAMEAYKEAIKINPNYAEAYFNLGVSYIMLRDGPSVFEQYKKLLELDPQLAEELYQVAF